MCNNKSKQKNPNQPTNQNPWCHSSPKPETNLKEISTTHYAGLDIKMAEGTICGVALPLVLLVYEFWNVSYPILSF